MTKYMSCAIPTAREGERERDETRHRDRTQPKARLAMPQIEVHTPTNVWRALHDVVDLVLHTADRNRT